MNLLILPNINAGEKQYLTWYLLALYSESISLVVLNLCYNKILTYVTFKMLVNVTGIIPIVTREC